ncbi:histone deacetylase [Candidatus Bathyarchaeota archaeon]|nr:histone deacetylase [Candidatus Bathyarchaeota archaeon]
MGGENLTITGLVYHPTYLKHDTGWGHPERPERISRTFLTLKKKGLLDNPKIKVLTPEPADIEDLASVHSKEYIEKIRLVSISGGALTTDTPLKPETFEIARLSAGGAIHAGKAVAENDVKNSFALIRPPGHHAGRDYGGGFCYFNNVAVMIEYLRKNFGMRRFMIIDWDVHHGNGTQDIFYRDPSVLYFSTHQMPLYPGTGYITEIGEGEGRGYTVNLPLPAGTPGDVYDQIIGELIIPLAEEFKPDMIVASAGFDAYYGDPIANLQFTTQTYINITSRLIELTDKVCKGRLTMILEGGYDLEAVPKIITEVISTLAGLGNYAIEDSHLPIEQGKIREVEDRIRKLKTILSDYWKTLR